MADDEEEEAIGARHPNNTHALLERKFGRRTFVLTVVGGAVLGVSALRAAARQDPAGGPTVHLEAGDIYFEPTEFTVAVGDTIEMVNVGALEHDFAIEGSDIDVELPVGGQPVQWTVPDTLPPGTYTFFCEVPGHRQSGMEGTITILPAGAVATPGTPGATPGATPMRGTPEPAGM